MGKSKVVWSLGDGFVLLAAGSQEPEVPVLSLATHHHLLQSLQPDWNMDSAIEITNEWSWTGSKHWTFIFRAQRGCCCAARAGSTRPGRAGEVSLQCFPGLLRPLSVGRVSPTANRKHEDLQIWLLREDVVQKPNPLDWTVWEWRVSQSQLHEFLGISSSAVECFSVLWGICSHPWPLIPSCE